MEDIAAVRMAAAAGKRAFAGGGPRTPRGMEIWFRQQLPEKSERRSPRRPLPNKNPKINIQSPETDR